MTDRETLAARIEAAGVDEQRVMLGAAFNLLNPAPRSNFEDLNAHCAKGLRFKRMLDAEAYLDAAMMLVPEGSGVHLNRYWIKNREDPVWSAELVSGPALGPSRVDECFDAATPALALAAAAIRAGGV